MNISSSKRFQVCLLLFLLLAWASFAQKGGGSARSKPNRSNPNRSKLVNFYDITHNSQENGTTINGIRACTQVKESFFETEMGIIIGVVVFFFVAACYKRRKAGNRNQQPEQLNQPQNQIHNQTTDTAGNLKPNPNPNPNSQLQHSNTNPTPNQSLGQVCVQQGDSKDVKENGNDQGNTIHIMQKEYKKEQKEKVMKSIMDDKNVNGQGGMTDNDNKLQIKNIMQLNQGINDENQ